MLDFSDGFCVIGIKLQLLFLLQGAEEVIKVKFDKQKKARFNLIPFVFGYGNLGDGEKSFKMSTVVNLNKSSEFAFGLLLSSSDIIASGFGTGVVWPNLFLTS